MLSSDPLSVLYYLVFGNMSAIETWLATDNPLRNLLSVAWQRTTDEVGRYNIRPRYNFNVTAADFIMVHAADAW